jgi:hypothetical protein
VLRLQPAVVLPGRRIPAARPGALTPQSARQTVFTSV